MYVAIVRFCIQYQIIHGILRKNIICTIRTVPVPQNVEVPIFTLQLPYRENIILNKVWSTRRWSYS